MRTVLVSSSDTSREHFSIASFSISRSIFTEYFSRHQGADHLTLMEMFTGMFMMTPMQRESFGKIAQRLCLACAHIRTRCVCSSRKARLEGYRDLDKCRCRYGCACPRVRRLYEILNRIPDKDVEELGFQPKYLVSRVIPIMIP